MDQVRYVPPRGFIFRGARLLYFYYFHLFGVGGAGADEGGTCDMGDVADFGDGGYGMLIWKAIVDGTFVLFNGSTLSGVGKGNLILPTASPTIKNNLTYITQTYGTNPKN